MPAPAKLVTLTQAKAQLHITLPDGDPGDAEIQAALDEAEAIVLDYVKGAGGQAASWTDPISAPGPVTQSIKVVLTRVYEKRGDDDTDFPQFFKRVEILLSHFHTPGVA